MNPKEAKPELLAKNDRVELYAVPGRYGEGPGIMGHDTITLDTRARMAISFVERWALVAAMEDGEDSAGRQKLRALTAQELAAKACDAVAALCVEFEARGWQLPAVSFADVEQAMKPVLEPVANPLLQQEQKQSSQG